MALNYTYDDFMKALEQSGLKDRFSAYDLQLAQVNPSAGMGILSAKQDYLSATDDAARAAANQRSEAIRKQYGNYTSGSFGTEYNPIATPSSFNPGTAPTYTDNYASDKSSIYDQLKNYPAYNYDAPKPEYSNQYAGLINSLLGSVVNYGPFNYDYKTDPAYSAYKKEYTREGQRATADVLGSASAATGGRVSSYAATAASQAGDYYASQLADKIPELYNAAYNRYLQEFQNQLAKLTATQGVEQSEYAKYLDQLSQYNIDRNFDYGVYSDDYNRLLSQLDAARALEGDEYSKYLNALSQYNTDRSFNYGQFIDDLNYKNMLDETAYSRTRDALSDQERAYQNQLTEAELAARYGDYSRLQAMGINPAEQTDYETALKLAQIAAQYGDYSGLRALGIDTSAYEAMNAQSRYKDLYSDEYKRQLELARLAAQYGDYSGLQALGIDTSSYQAGKDSESTTGRTQKNVADNLTSGLVIEDYGNGTYVLKTLKGWFPLPEKQAAEVAYAYKRLQDGKATDSDYTVLRRYFTSTELGVDLDLIDAENRFMAGDYSDEVIQRLLAGGYTQQQINAAIRGNN